MTNNSTEIGIENTVIALFAYNRKDKLLLSLNALESCPEFNSLPMHIFIDGPKNSENEQKVLDVIECAKSFQHSNKKITCRRSNLGAGAAISTGIEEVFQQYGRCIIIEDDIVVGRSFVRYMLDALHAYETSNQVFGIAGFNFVDPPITIKSQSYFLPLSSIWGWATWRDRWFMSFMDDKALLNEIDNKRLVEKMDFGGYPYFKMLNDQVSGLIDAWAIQFYTRMVLNKGIFLFPPYSISTNIGFDNSGTHANPAKFLLDKTLNHEVEFEYVHPSLDEQVVHDVEKLFRKSFKGDQSFLAKIILKIKKVYHYALSKI